MRYRNLLESVAPQDLERERVALLERVASGELQIPLGVLRESIGSDYFANLTADLTHKRLMKGFTSIPGSDDWRKIVVIANAVDFKFQNAIRAGGYATLDSVPESGTYKAKVFVDEKARYQIAKYGNLENWSLEAMANDEIGALGRSQERMGTAAVRTLLNFVFNTLIDANPTCTYDSTALFAAGHNNDLGASKPLNETNLEAAWGLLRKQTGLDGEKLNLVPRILIVHPDQEALANRLVNSELVVAGGDTTVGVVPASNFFRGRLQVITTPYITTTRYYVCADPSQSDTIEIGFYQGQETPQFFVEAKGSGVEFERDAMRTKTRYIFGGTPLDHRWIVRANV